MGRAAHRTIVRYQFLQWARATGNDATWRLNEWSDGHGKRYQIVPWNPAACVRGDHLTPPMTGREMYMALRLALATAVTLNERQETRSEPNTSHP